MSVLRRKPLFSIFHHPCAWANSPWLTKCESNNFGWAAKERWSQILLWKRRTQRWWRWPVDRSGFWSFLSPSFFSSSILPWVIPTEWPSIAKSRVWRGKEMNVVFLKLTEVGSSGFTAVSQRAPNSYTFWNLILHLAFYEDEILGRWLFCFLTSYQTL